MFPPRPSLAVQRLLAADGGVAAVLGALLLVSSTVAGVGLVGAGSSVTTTAAATQPVDGCTTITEPGNYELVTDLDVQTADRDECISIMANGVVFDGGGHTIRGNGSGTGVRIGECCSDGPADVVVRDVTVVHFSFGITSFKPSRLRIRDVKVVWSDATGMSGGDGISLSRGTDLVVEDSIVVNCETRALDISGSDIVVRNNWIVRNDGGLNGFGTNYLVAGNDFENNGGISLWLQGPANHTARNNTVVNGTWKGIVVHDDVRVVDNVVRNNSDVGIEASDGSIVTGNRVVANGKGGVRLDEPGALVYDNYLANERNVVGPEGEAESPFGATWNVTSRSGTNVVGGSVVGGNYWASPDGTGYSETCTDADADGLCDEPYSVPGTQDVDRYPLADPVETDPAETTTARTTSTTGTTAVTTTTRTTAGTTSTATTTDTATATTTAETPTATTSGTTTRTTYEGTRTTAKTSAETTAETTTSTGASATTTTEEPTTTTTATTTTSADGDGDSSGSGSVGTGGTAGGRSGGSQDESDETRDGATTETTTTGTPTTEGTITTTGTATTSSRTTAESTTTATQVTATRDANAKTMTSETAGTTDGTAGTTDGTAATATTTAEEATERSTETAPATAGSGPGATTTGTAPFSSVEIPGFEVVTGVLALLGGAVLALRRG